MRVDKLTLASLEATTEIHLAGTALADIPTLRMLSETAAGIRARCDLVLEQIHGLCNAEVTACQSPVGGGSIPGVTMDSFAVKIGGRVAHRVADRLRAGQPAVQPRVTDDCVLLDLRTVADDQVGTLVDKLRDALGEHEDDRA